MKTFWWIKSLTDVIYPRLCPVCGRTMVEGETIMCLHCLTEMPRTNLHSSTFNALHQHIGHKTPVERTAAWFHYERESHYAGLIHLAKYRSMPRLARSLGSHFAHELASSGFFAGIDIIEPVPLSWPRLLKRGYNQSAEIARGINSVTGIPVGNHLRARIHSTQTRKDAQQRWDNVNRIYYARPDAKAACPGHILIVDDIITTGATMAACATALRTLWPHAVISILSIGATRLA